MYKFGPVESGLFISTLAVPDILTCEIFDLEKVCQSHEVHLSQCRCSMANIKIFTKSFYIFAPVLTVSEM